MIRKLKISADRFLDLLFGYAGHSSQLAGGLATMFIVTWYAGLDVYGIWVALNALQTLVGRVFCIPTNELLFYFSAKKLDRNSSLAILVVCLLIDIIVSGVLFLAIFIFADYFIELFLDGEVSKDDFLIYFVYVILLTTRNFSLAYWLSEGAYRKSVLLGVLEQTLKILLLFYFFGFLRGDNIDSVIYAALIAALPISVLFLLRPVLFVAKRLELLSFRDLKVVSDQAFSYIRISYFNYALNGLTKSIDNLLVAYFFSNQVVGLYATLKQFSMPLTYIVAPVINLSYRSFSKSLRAEEFSNIVNVISTSLKYLLLILMPSFVFATAALYMYTAVQEITFERRELLVYLFTFIATSTSVTYWWSRPLAAVYNPRLSIHAQIIFLLIYLSLVAPLSRTAGLIGFSLVSCICSIGLLLYWVKVLNRFKSKEIG